MVQDDLQAKAALSPVELLALLDPTQAMVPNRHLPRLNVLLLPRHPDLHLLPPLLLQYPRAIPEIGILLATLSEERELGIFLDTSARTGSTREIVGSAKKKTKTCKTLQRPGRKERAYS